jgi:hypothetical protein
MPQIDGKFEGTRGELVDGHDLLKMRHGYLQSSRCV